MSFYKALEERKSMFGDISVPSGNTYSYLRLVYKNLRLLDKAIENYLKADEVYRQVDDIDMGRIAIVHNNLSNLYTLSGDYENAISYLRNTERIIIENNLINEPVHESMLINFALVYRGMKEYDKAKEYINKALKLFSEGYRELKKRKELGNLYFDMEDYHSALREFEYSLKLGEKYFGDDYNDKLQIYTNIGSVYLRLEDFDNALKYFSLGRNIVVKNFGNQNYYYSFIQNNIGDVYLKKSENVSSLEQFVSLKQKNLLAALNAFQKALIAISVNFDNSDIYANPNTLEKTVNDLILLENLKGKGESFKKLAILERKHGKKENEIKYLISALDTYEIALDLINRIRNGFLSQESKMILAENEQFTHYETCNIAATLFELTNDSKYFEKAFQVSERGKSASFLAALKDLKARDFGGIPDSLLKREDNIKSELAAYKELLMTAYETMDKDSSKIKLWESKLFDLEQKHSNLIAFYEKEYPDYYSFKYSNRVVSLSEIQNRLQRRDAIIEFVVNEPAGNKKGEVISFLIKKDQFRIKRTIIDSLYNKSINKFLGFLKNGQAVNTTKKDYLEYTKSAYSLYSLLIAPFEKHLKGYRVVCIPDGKLAYLPFDALISEIPDSTRMNFRNLKYLVKDFAISYSYSATLLYDYFKKDAQAPNTLIAFAPSYAIHPDSDSEFTKVNRGILLPLPGAKDEVKGIIDMIPGDLFEGEMATETSFKNNVGEYDILHLAMHTVLNDSLPMNSRLVFEKDKNGDNNGWLDIYEIYNMKFKARLAVLSACKTGDGILHKGEGVMSLARGFLYAGCPSIIMTLWNVEDDASSKIMIDFYKNLLDGYPKDEALRKAKLNHLETADPLKAHPYYWLGYVSVGDQTPLFSTKMPYFIALILGVIVIILLEKYISARKKRSSI